MNAVYFKKNSIYLVAYVSNMQLLLNLYLLYKLLCWRRTKMAELAAKHLTWNEAKGTAQNRVRWRALVEDLCST